MLIVRVRPDEKIESALKRFKNKFRHTQVMQQIRRREQYIKPSVQRRKEKEKAVYREEYRRAK